LASLLGICLTKNLLQIFKEVVHQIFACVPLEPIFIAPKTSLMETRPLIEKLSSLHQPIIEVKLVDTKLKVSKPIRAMIDTGSHHSVCASGLLFGAEFENTGLKANQQAFGGKSFVSDILKGRILIEKISQNLLIDFYFTTDELVFTEIDIIIGVDFLSNFTFLYNVPMGSFTIDLNHKKN